MKTWRIYQIPYFFDGDVTTVKYLGIEFPERVLQFATLEDLRPDEYAGIFAVNGTDEDHEWLAAFEDVEIKAS